jgi:pimeloyl-ACP methyl ester carboxylesterase
VFAVIAFLLVFYFLYPVYRVYAYVRPPRFRVSDSPPTGQGLNCQAVSFSSADGLKLAAWYAASRNGAAVILVHGYGGNRMAMLAHARMLAQSGYGVLLYDMRAHGNSEGRLFAGGRDAPADVLGAVAYLRRRLEVRPERIGVLGVSMGGQVALRAAACAEEIRAVVADGPGPAAIKDVTPPVTPVGWFYLPLQPIYGRALTWYTRVAPPDPLIETISCIAPRSVLLISTGRRQEQRLVRRFFEAAEEPKRLWEIPEALHASGWLARPEAYAERIVAFFDETLLDCDGA